MVAAAVREPKPVQAIVTVFHRKHIFSTDILCEGLANVQSFGNETLARAVFYTVASEVEQSF